MADKNLTNIQIYQRKTKYNIGVILFGIIFIYLVITMPTRVLFSETNRLSRQILMDM